MTDMQIDDWKDAKEPAWFWCNVKAIRRCHPRDPGNCAGYHGIMDTVPNAKDCRVFNEYSYIWYKGDDVPTRYLNSADVRRLAKLNDLEKRSSILRNFMREFKETGRTFPFKLLPIIAGSARSKEYLRSKEMRAVRQLSRQRAKEKKAKGEAPRKYDSPKARGLRSGAGLAHSWEVR
jgi:hypothetical protein